MVSIVEPDTEVLVTRFHIRLSGDQCGQMRLIIPYLTLEPLRKKIQGPGHHHQGHRRRLDHRHYAAGLGHGEPGGGPLRAAST